MDLIILGLIGFFLMFLLNWIFMKRIPSNTVIVFTGTMGSGKSFLGVKQTIKHYRKMRILYFFRFINVKPAIYSNIPLSYGKRFIFFGRSLWANKLTMQHLTGLHTISEYASIFYDEVGDVTDQYSYNNPLVQQFIQKFTRYARHWLDPQLVLCTQAIDDIAKPIRSKVSQVYHLKDFRRYGLIFYKVNVLEIQRIEDNESLNTIDTKTEYFFGFPLPFKYLKKLNKILFPFNHKLYDTRCYSIMYDPKYVLPNQWQTYKTKEIIDIPNIPDMFKEFKSKGYITQDNAFKYIDNWSKKDLKESKK